MDNKEKEVIEHMRSYRDGCKEGALAFMNELAKKQGKPIGYIQGYDDGYARAKADYEEKQNKIKIVKK